MEPTIVLTPCKKFQFLPFFLLLLLRSRATAETVEDRFGDDELLGANELWPGGHASYPVPFGLQIPVTGDGNLSGSWNRSRGYYSHRYTLTPHHPQIRHSVQSDSRKDKNQKNRARAPQRDGRKMKSFHSDKAGNGGMSAEGQPRRRVLENEKGRLRANVSKSQWALVHGGLVSVFPMLVVIWGIIGRTQARDEQLKVDEDMSSTGRSIYRYAAISSSVGLLVIVIYVLGKKYCKR